MMDADSTWVTAHAALTVFHVMSLTLAALTGLQLFRATRHLHHFSACLGLALLALGDMQHLALRFANQEASLWCSELGMILGSLLILSGYVFLPRRRARQIPELDYRVAVLVGVFALFVFALSSISLAVLVGAPLPALLSGAGPSDLYAYSDAIIIGLLVLAALSAILSGDYENYSFRHLLAGALILNALARIFFIEAASFSDITSWAGHLVRAIADGFLLTLFFARYNQMRQDVKAFSQRFRVLFEHVADSILVVDTSTGRFLEVNQAAVDFYGYTREEFSKLTVAQIIHEEDRAAFLASEQTMAGNGQACLLDHRHITRDGTVKYVRCNTALTEYKGEQATVTIVADMTASRELQEEVRRSEALYRGLFRQAGRAICVIDEQDMIADANEEACLLLGATRDKLLGRRWLHFFTQAPDAECEAMYRAVLNTGRADVEITTTRVNGEAFPAEVNIVALDTGAEPLYLALLQDLTGRRQAEARMLQGERLRALGQMAGGIAHDIRNTLSSVLGWAQLAQLHEAPPQVQRALAVIEQTASDGTQTLMRIQQFARARSDKKLEVVDLKEIAADIVEATRPRWQYQAQRQDILITVDTQLSDVPSFLCNAAELREVGVNLIFNACDAMPEGGQITVSTRYERGAACLSVTDTGIGIPPEDLSRIFEAFYTTKGTESTGLGLSLSRGIIEHYGGELLVDSTPGKGTTMTISLPVKPAHEPAPAARRVQAAPRGRPLHVLVVDDDATIGEMLSLSLTNSGHTVNVVSTGAEALTSLESGEYDLLITDLGLTDTTGWQVAENAKRCQPDLPVILITGWGDLYDTNYPAVDRILTKPMSLSELHGALEALTGGS